MHMQLYCPEHSVYAIVQSLLFQTGLSYHFLQTEIFVVKISRLHCLEHPLLHLRPSSNSTSRNSLSQAGFWWRAGTKMDKTWFKWT